jgi:aryl-alcohol dehydrogenase-like predicted oxidoreductase
MNQRALGSTGLHASEIGFGGWAIGGSWGHVAEDQALAALHAALDEGVTFLDTADVYGDGRSERRIARALADRTPQERARIVVATKAGRRLDPHVAEGYVHERLAPFVDRSRENLGVETLDLLQLHCPPTEAYRRDAMYDALERLADEGRIRFGGVSVETEEEALLALERPVVRSIQIIYNPFRRKPAERVFPLAREQGVGIVVRVPLASGLLTGKFDEGATFEPDDHRAFNRHGEAFDVGETFAGVDFATGVEAARELKRIVPEGATLAQATLRWILMEPAVSTVIPGAKRPDQARENARAAALPALSEEAMAHVRRVYDRRIREQVHPRW